MPLNGTLNKRLQNKSGIPDIMSHNYQCIKWKKEENIAFLTLNRPDNMNTITRQMSDEIQEALKSAIYDETIRCLLLTGDGKAFCAGQNLREITDRWNQDEYELGDTVRSNYIPIIRMIVQMEMPVLCGVNGVAAGAGANLAFACDLLTASEHAFFVQSFAKIGLIPDSGGTYFLPRLIGPHRAKQLMMLDEKLSASRASEWGLVYQVYAEKEFMAKTKELAAYLASQPTRGFALTKKALNQTYQNSIEEQLELEAKLQSKAGNTEDFKEGVRSFLEKRKPQFKGN